MHREVWQVTQGCTDGTMCKPGSEYGQQTDPGYALPPPGFTTSSSPPQSRICLSPLPPTTRLPLTGELQVPLDHLFMSQKEMKRICGPEIFKKKSYSLDVYSYKLFHPASWILQSVGMASVQLLNLS